MKTMKAAACMVQQPNLHLVTNRPPPSAFMTRMLPPAMLQTASLEIPPHAQQNLSATLKQAPAAVSTGSFLFRFGQSTSTVAGINESSFFERQQSLPISLSMNQPSSNQPFLSQSPPLQKVQTGIGVPQMGLDSGPSHPSVSRPVLQGLFSTTAHLTSTPLTAQKLQEEPSVSNIASPLMPTPVEKLFASNMLKDSHTSVDHDRKVVERSVTIPWSSTIGGMGSSEGRTGETSQIKTDVSKTEQINSEVPSNNLLSDHSDELFGHGFSRSTSTCTSSVVSFTSGFDFGFERTNFMVQQDGSSMLEKNDGTADDDRNDGTQFQYGNVDDNNGPEFKPVVSLPDLVELKTGEEDEEELFVHRAKLFRYDKEVAQWKDRGIGNIKILRNKTTNTYRVVMRREWVLKVCANHYITRDMDLKARCDSDCSWVWSTLADVADGKPKQEQLTVKFKYPAVAKQFKDVFDSCKEQLASTNVGDRCKSNVTQMPNGTAKQTIVETSVADEGRDCVPLSEKFLNAHESWNCSHCLVVNKPNVAKCAACGTPSPHTSCDSLMPKYSSSQTRSFQFQQALLKPPEIAETGNVSMGSFTEFTDDSISLLPSSQTRTGSNVGSVPPSRSRPIISQRTSNGNSPNVVAETSIISNSDITMIEGELTMVSDKEVIVKSPMPQSVAVLGSSLQDNLEVSGNCQINGENGFVENSQDDNVDKHVDKHESPVCIDESDFESNTSEAVQSEADEIIFLFERHPTAEQLEKANKFQLPSSFYLYEDRVTPPWCRNEEIDSDQDFIEVQFPSTNNEKTNNEKTNDSVRQSGIEDSQIDGLGNNLNLVGPETATAQTFLQLASSSTSGFSFLEPLSDETFTFQGTGRRLFALKETADDYPHDPEEEADVDFAPVVELRGPISLKTGEEGMSQVFSNRAKLYRFDKNTTQWKERGVGDIKLLKDQNKRRLRLVMRREQVLKVCANHYITEDMELAPHPSSDRSWIWFTPADFSEQIACAEKLAVRFRSTEIAEQFKMAFDRYKSQRFNDEGAGTDFDNSDRDNSDADNTNGALVNNTMSARPIGHNDNGDTICDQDVMFVWERKPTADQRARALQFLLPPTFYLYEDQPSPEDNSDDGLHDGSTMMKGEGDYAASNGKSKERNSEISKTQSPQNIQSSDYKEGKNDEKACVAESKLLGSRGHAFLSFADLAAMSNSSVNADFPVHASSSPIFSGGGSLVFGDTTLAGNENDVVNNEDIYFKPICSLPESVDIKTGEEEEIVVFCERSKLFRLDRQSGSWKERGIGDMKLLWNSETCRGRVVMRREQVLKVCTNHYIIPEMELKANAGSDCSWVWVAPCGYSEEMPTTEQLAVRFKTPEQAKLFKEKFDQLKQGQLSLDMDVRKGRQFIGSLSETDHSTSGVISKTCDPEDSAALEDMIGDPAKVHTESPDRISFREGTDQEFDQNGNSE